MNLEKYKSTIGFTDLLFNILVGFAFLFIVAFLLIKPEAKKEDFERKAEFVIILEWDNDAVDDIDLYVSDPNGDVVNFRLPRINYMHLDKDDLGRRNDVIYVNGQEKHVAINREVVTIRGIMKGEYIVNAHFYSDYAKRNFDVNPLEVKVEVHKVNPYSIVFTGEKKYTSKGQEKTFVRFRLDRDGIVLTPFTFEEKKFVAPWAQAQGDSSGSYGTPIHGNPSDYESGDLVEDEPSPGEHVGSGPHPAANDLNPPPTYQSPNPDGGY